MPDSSETNSPPSQAGNPPPQAAPSPLLPRSAPYLTKSTAVVAILIGILVIWLINRTYIETKPTLAFLVTIAILACGFVVIGLGINGRPGGVLIDNRNRISLAKFQMVMWTVLVIASLVVIASHNLALGIGEPLNLTIPTELLAAMGISAGSFVASPLVLSLKSDQNPTNTDATAAVAKSEADGSPPAFAGKIFARDDPKGAVWSDMLVGEEVGNCSSPDLGKIQQLFISILLVGVYGFSVKDELLSQATNNITSFPVLSESFVWLLAVSHASYLAYKAAPHTRDGDSTKGQST